MWVGRVSVAVDDLLLKQKELKEKSTGDERCQILTQVCKRKSLSLRPWLHTITFEPLKDTLYTAHLKKNTMQV